MISSCLLSKLLLPLLLLSSVSNTALGSVMYNLGASVEKTLEMVVTANPLATEAGERILQAGGSAADAMVAIQAVLGLVEPESSGIGGGAFVVYYDAESGKLTTFDGRETAPASATPDLFVNMTFPSAWQSGLSVGVPGVPRLLETVHQKYGTLPWNQDLFQDAIDLATEGYEMTAKTAGIVNALLGFNAQFGFDCENRFLWRDQTAFEYFVSVTVDSENSTTCSAVPAGTLMTNIPYAETLQLLSTEGGVDTFFYKGSIAKAIATAVQNDPSIPGDLTVDDISEYKVIERPPVCLQNYKGNKQVCGMGPPSSGGLAVGQILGILDNFNDGYNYTDTNATINDDPLGVDAVHYFSQAMRLAFADRNQYVGDSDFVTVPSEGMLDLEYLAERATLIGEMDMGIVDAGIPPGVDTSTRSGADTRSKTTGTSHISIIDRCGNALSMTTTVEAPFGNGVMVNGFLLNNELTDFSFAPFDEEGNPIANRVEGRKRPRSSMSPTIILDENGKPELLTGSPGGTSIIGYTAQSIYNMYDFGLDPQSAAGLPHYQNQNEEATLLETPVANVTADYDVSDLSGKLESRGHVVSLGELQSGLGIIMVQDDTFIGGADLRRDGTVGGSDQSDDEPDTSHCERKTPGGDDSTTDSTEESSDDSGAIAWSMAAASAIVVFTVALTVV